MTKKEKLIIHNIGLKVEHIVKWDNKNLKNKQYYDLDDCLSDIKKLLNVEDYESLWQLAGKEELSIAL